MVQRGTIQETLNFCRVVMFHHFSNTRATTRFFIRKLPYTSTQWLMSYITYSTELLQITTELKPASASIYSMLLHWCSTTMGILV